MLSTYALFAMLLPSISGQIHLWDPNLSFNVITSLQKIYLARCVFLLSPEDMFLLDRPRIVETKKMLSKIGVFSSLIGLEELRRPLRCHANRPLVVVFGHEEDTLKYLRGLDRVPSHPRWVMFFDGDPKIALDGVFVGFDCTFFVVRALARPQGRGIIAEAYRMERHTPLLVKQFAEFTPELGLDMKGRDLQGRRRNLNGVKIRVCARNYPPLVAVVRIPGEPIRVEGFLGAVWKILEAELNFTTEFSLSPSGQTSGLLENGSWTGCMGAIQQHLADVTGADLTMTIDRTRLLDYIYPGFTTNNRYYMVGPAASNLSWGNFLAPFSPRLWLAVASTIVLLSLSLLVAHHCGRWLGTEKVDGAPTMGASQALVYMLGLACGQGHDRTPEAASGRIVYQIGALTGVIVSAAYAAALISFLTAEVKEFPVNSFEDLAKGRVKLGIRVGSGQFTLLETTADPLLRRIYDKLLKPTLSTLPTTDEEGLLKICADPNYGFVTYAEKISGVIAMPCRIAPAPGIFLPARFAFAAVKGYPFRDILNSQMLRMRGCGTLRGLRWKFWPQVYPTETSDFNSVSIEQSTPILAVLVAGILLGVGIMLLERCRSCHKGGSVTVKAALKLPEFSLQRKSESSVAGSKSDRFEFHN